MFVLDHQEQIFNRHPMLLRVIKMSRQIVQRLLPDKCHNKLFEPIGWSLLHSQNGQFLSKDAVGGINRIKTP